MESQPASFSGRRGKSVYLIFCSPNILLPGGQNMGFFSLEKIDKFDEDKAGEVVDKSLK